MHAFAGPSGFLEDFELKKCPQRQHVQASCHSSATLSTPIAASAAGRNPKPPSHPGGMLGKGRRKRSVKRSVRKCRKREGE
jgi:hypothetical protein